MIALEINQIKKFMYDLLLTDAFDSFRVLEVSIVTFAEFHIDGRLHPEFYGDVTKSAEAEDRPDGSSPVPDGKDEGTEKPSGDAAGRGETLVPWKSLREHCLALIRGKRTPVSFQIIFQLPKSDIAALIQKSGASLSEEEVHSLSLNCLYRDGRLQITTGSSLAVFIGGRTLEQAWEESVKEFFRKLGLD